jgi:hypothetical protein
MLILIIVLLLLFGGGWYGNGRWYNTARAGTCTRARIVGKKVGKASRLTS